MVEDLKVKLSESAGIWKAEKVAIIAEFKAEFQDLSASLQSVEKELASSTSHNESLTEDLKIMSEDLQELEAEFEEYRENNSDKEYAEALEIDLNTVRDDLRQARERADLLEKDNVKIPDMKALADKLQVEVRALERKEAKQALQLGIQEDENNTLTRDYKAASIDLKNAQAEISKLDHDLKHLTAEKETEVSEKVSQLQALEKDLQRSLSQLQESQQQQQQTQGEVAQTLQSLHEVVQNNVAELEKFEAEKARKVKELEDKIIALTCSLEASHVKSAKLADDIKSLDESSRREQDRLQTDLGDAQLALEKKEQESIGLSEKIHSLEGDLDSAMREAEHLRSGTSGLEKEISDRDVLIGSLEQDLVKTSECWEEEKRGAAKLDEEKGQLQKEVERKGNELKLKDEVFALREKTLESGSENLLQDFEKKQRECDTIETERRDLLADLEKKTADLLEKEEKIQDNEDAISSLEKRKNLLDIELANSKADVEKLKKKIDLLRQSSQEHDLELIEEVKKHQGVAQALEAQLGTTNQDRDNLQKDIADRDALVESLEQDLVKTSKCLEEAKRGAAKLEEELEKKRDDVKIHEALSQTGETDLDFVFKNWDQEVTKLQEQKNAIEAGKKELHAKLEEKKDDVNKFEALVRTGETDLDFVFKHWEQEVTKRLQQKDTIESERNELCAELEQSQKPRKAAAASSRMKAEASGIGHDVYSDEDSSMQDECFMNVEEQYEEKYVEKRAEVETLHIGLDSLLGEFKTAQDENDELVEILKSRDDMLLESVAVLEDRESALVQIKTLEDGVENILQELVEVKREKDEVQHALNESLDQQANLLRRWDESQKLINQIQQDQKANDDALSTLKASEMKADIDKSMLSDLLTQKQNELKEVEADRNSAKAETLALVLKLQEGEQQQRNDVSDIKQLVHKLDDGLKAMGEENGNLRGGYAENVRDDEFKESGNGSDVSRVDDVLRENINRDINKCQHLSDWLIDEALLVPSSALNYSTLLVRDGKSSVRRLRKAVIIECNYLANIGIHGDDASAIIAALDIEGESGRRNTTSSLLPMNISPSAPRQYARAANGRLSLSPSVSGSSRSRTPPESSLMKHPLTFSSYLLPQESNEEEKKESTTNLSQKDIRLSQLEAQAAEAARIAAAASEEADRIAQLYHNRRHSMDSSGSVINDRCHHLYQKGSMKKKLRQEQKEVVKAQEIAYIAATRARDAFFLTTTTTTAD